MTTPPVASSSRLRLDATAPSPPPPPSTTRRRRALRRTARNMAMFVLAVSAPYLAAASPVVATLRGHDPIEKPHDDPWSARIADTAVIGGLRLLQGTLRAAEHLFRRETTRADSEWPILETFTAVARMSTTDHNGVIVIDQKYYKLTASMNAGFIVLSYLIAFVGSLCTLELLIRRTSNRGLSNLVLLATAGICFGSVSTFAMHFVGNQSLALHYPSMPEFRNYTPLLLSYKGGYTVLSLVASCLAMTFAFFVMGTDIHFPDWRSWPCVPGSRQHRQDDYTGTRDDYTRWKLQKATSRKSANVSTIFQQAGMMASWPMMEKGGAKGWRHWMFGRSQVSLEPVSYDAEFGSDEDTLVKRDKELGELDFRLGRGAVRDEIDRRQGNGPASPLDSVMPTPEASLMGVPSGFNDLPSSPLAAYYPTGATDTTRDIVIAGPPPPINVRRPPSPTGVFAAGYQFPPRTPTDATGSTAALIPRDQVPAVPAPTWFIDGNDQVQQIPRRSSLPPPLNVPPPPRMAANTLSRIQSLPEQDGDIPQIRYSSDTKEKSIQPGSGSGSEETGAHIHNMDAVPYDDDDMVFYQGWRSRLRTKVQAGLPLTTVEKVERFFGLDIVTWGDVSKILLTGMLAGWGIAGMHYIGQVSIMGIPYIAYHVGYVVGSVIIASGAVIIALYIMFIMLRPKLKHSWTSKIMVAIILAGAVCGMHYCAMMGTIYGWDVGRPPNSGGTATKRAITGLVAALAFLACLGVTIFIMINSIRDRKERARRRRVVVASVLLDEQDRMLVSAIDGLLLMCDIASLASADSKKKADRADPSTLGVDLTTGNEAFVQAVKMSWSWRNPFWSSLNPFTEGSPSQNGLVVNTPSIAGDVRPNPTRRGSTMTTAAESVTSAIAATRGGGGRFLEKFAISATQLSVRLTGQSEGVSRLGVLYDQILTTGWVRLHNGKDTVSKGQLIFLVRRVTSSQERSDLLSRHFIFADPTSVAQSLHKTLSTPFEHVMPFLEDMRSFCDNTMRMTLRPNTLYAGITIVQATPFDGLRILLNQKNRSQLPMSEICTFSTLPGLPVNVAEGLAGTLDEIGEAVTWLEGMNLLSVITRNMSAEATRVGGPRVGRLLAALERAVVPMLDALLTSDDMAYILPRLQLHPVLVPLTPSSPPRKGTPGWAPPHIIVFYANYDVAVNTTVSDKWMPFRLFRAQHDCVMSSKISFLNRASEAALMRTPRAPSPALSPGLSCGSSGVVPDAARYNYARRPSKVQFEVPSSEAAANYSFPPREGSTNGHIYPASIYSAATSLPSPTTSFPPHPYNSRDRMLPRRSSLVRSTFRGESDPADPAVQVRPGVATWDPSWLINLLRTRLRSEP